MLSAETLPSAPPLPPWTTRCVQVNDLADSFKRSLAEMENLRQRTTRQIENAQKFAVEVSNSMACSLQVSRSSS